MYVFNFPSLSERTFNIIFRSTFNKETLDKKCYISVVFTIKLMIACFGEILKQPFSLYSVTKSLNILFS